MATPYLIECERCHKENRRKNKNKYTCRNCRIEMGKIVGYPRTYYTNKSIALKRDGNHCQCCKSRNNLNIHHLDINKLNNSPSNLITLCQACHHSLHQRYSDKELRCGDIRKMFPTIFRLGKFGTRAFYKPESPIKITVTQKRKYFKSGNKSLGKELALT